MDIREVIKSPIIISVVEKIIGKDVHDEIVRECTTQHPVINGYYNQIQNFNSDQIFFNNDNFMIFFEIETLIPEDGSGTKFLINYKSTTAKYHGYVDLKTMTGWLQKTKN